MRPSALSRVALDTTTYSQFRRGQADAFDVVSEAGVVLIPIVSIGEIKAGFLLGSRRGDNEALFADFIEEPFVSIIELTDRATDLYAQIFAKLRRAGTPIPTNDIWIAALTMSAGAHLVTFDSDFARVPGLHYTLLEA